MSIYKKLVEIQSAIKAPKSQYNKFGKYYYINIEDIQEAVKPYLKETKTTLVISDEIECIGDRYYIKATATLIDTEEGDSVSVSAFARESLDRKGMDDAQVTGTSSSYARKYALSGLLLLDDTKDSDSVENDSQEVAKRPQKPSKQSEREDLVRTLKLELDRTGIGMKYIRERFKVEKNEDMTDEQLSLAIAQLSSKPPKPEGLPFK